MRIPFSETGEEWAYRMAHEHRWDALATYNAERARGIVHTEEWRAKMAEEQKRFDEEQGLRPTTKI